MSEKARRERRREKRRERARNDTEADVLLARTHSWISGRKDSHAPRSEHLSALLASALDLGCRISEALALTIDQMLLEEETGRYVIQLGDAVHRSTASGLHRNALARTGMTEHVPMRMGVETSRLLAEDLARQEDPPSGCCSPARRAGFWMSATSAARSWVTRSRGGPG